MLHRPPAAPPSRRRSCDKRRMGCMRSIRPDARALRLASGQTGLINRRQCRALGISDRRLGTLVRSHVWRRVTQGVFDTGQGNGTVHPLDFDRQRAAWLGLLAGPPGAIATGLCALALHGVHGLPRQIDPEIALPDGRATAGAEGVKVRRYSSHMEVIQSGHWHVASVRCALMQSLPGLDRGSAVALLDSALHQGMLATEDLVWLESCLRGRRGCRRVRGWLEIADGRAASPIETYARLDCMDHGIPPDDLQVEVRDSKGVFVARADLGWRRIDGGWVLVEMDGQDVHGAPGALYRDRERQNAILTRSDALLLRFSGADALRSGVIPHQVRQALTR